MGQSHGAGSGQVAGGLGWGKVCLQNLTLSKVFVARKSTGSPVHARSIPLAPLFEIVVLVTISPFGCPKIAIAAMFNAGSGRFGGVPHEKLLVPVSPPAYSTCAKSICVLGSGVPQSRMPTQSPGAGVASLDVKTIGLSAVPTATS